MFDFFKRKEPDVADALTNQALGGQSFLYRLFREAIGCEDSNIRKLELTYFTAAVLTYVYLRFGTQDNRDEILDRFTQNILTKSIPSSKETISFRDVVKEYQGRYAEYNSMLPLLFDSNDSSSVNPAATLLMHSFECVTEVSARGRMIEIVAASGLIHQFVIDNIDFVKNKL